MLMEITNILTILEKATVEISGEEYVTGSIAIPLINCAKEGLSTLRPVMDVGKSLKQTLTQELLKRLGSIEAVHLLAMATVLDPRFKTLHFNDTLATARLLSYIRNELAKSVTGHNDESEIEDLHSSSDNQIWHDMKSAYPQLAKLALNYLGIVVSSVPAERLFSKAGVTVMQQRSRLNGKMLSKLLFLQSLNDRFW